MRMKSESASRGQSSGTHPDSNKMKKKKKKENNLRNFGGNKRWNNICIIGIRDKGGDKEREKLFEKWLKFP